MDDELDAWLRDHGLSDMGEEIEAKEIGTIDPIGLPETIV